MDNAIWAVVIKKNLVFNTVNNKSQNKRITKLNKQTHGYTQDDDAKYKKDVCNRILCNLLVIKKCKLE